MAIAFVQAVSDADTTTPNTITFPSNVAAGSLLVVLVRDSQPPATTLTVTDTRSNTWTQDVASTQTGSGRVYLVSAISNGAGSCAVTVTGTTNIRLAAYEFSGSFDSSRLESSWASSTTVSGSPEATGNVTTAGPAVLIAGCGAVSNVTFSAVTNSFTLGTTAASRLSPAYRIVSSGGTYNTEYSWTGTDNNVQLLLAAYKEVPGPTITVQPVADTVILTNETTVSFACTATGTGTVDLTAEMETSVGGGTYGTLANGSGATWTGLTGTGSGSASLSLAGTITAKTLSGRRVRIKAEDDNGISYSNAVALTIYDGPQLTTFPATNGSGVSTATLTCDYVTGVGEAIEVRIPLSDGDVAVTVTTT